MRIADVTIDDIDIIENVRVSMKERSMIELMENIKQNGLLQPIGVTKTASKRYILVYGHRRLVACKKLGWKTIPAIIGDTEQSLKDHLLINISENLQRVQNTPHELGRISHRLVSEFKMTAGEIAVRLNCSKQMIQASLDVFSAVPAALKDRVKFMGAGSNGKKSGDIPASLVQRVIALKRQHDLDTNDVDKILNMAQQGLMGTDRLTLVAAMLKNGVSPSNAIKNLEKYDYVPIKNIVVEKSEMDRLTKKYKRSRNGVIRGIFYGEFPALKRPEFYQEDTRGKD